MLQDPNLLERFRRESDALRRLNHPNIVKILDTVQEGDQYGIILEYVSGGSLRDLLDKQPQLPLEVALRIALELADALTRAHHLKIIHRDIKPANVLLAEDGTPRLTDFGLVRMAGETDPLTKTGSVIGTYAYLSPEAIEGNPPDARMDIWAYGVLLYEMLAGRRPFESDAPATMIYQILQAPVPDIREFRPDVPKGIISLLNELLEKDPQKRIGSIRHVGARLEDVIGTFDPQVRATIEVGMGESDRRLSRFSTPTPLSRDELLSISREPQNQPVAVKASPVLWVIAGLLVILIGVIGAVAIVFLDQEGGNPGTAPGEIITVDPVAPGEIMVLVAQLEALDEPDPTVDRFIIEDLREVFEQAQASAGIRIREYEGVLTSTEEAREAARFNQAAVVIWGNYTPGLIEVEILPHPGIGRQLPPELLEKTTAVRVRLTDPRNQSLAPQVLSTLAVWYAYEGSAFDSAWMMLVMDELNLTGGEVVGVTLGTHIHHYFNAFLTDTEHSVEHMDQALVMDPVNPILYHLRSLALLRLGRTTEGVEDLNSAIRLSQNRWAAPLVTLANLDLGAGDYEQALEKMNRAVELIPDDWFIYSMRGSAYYLMGDYPQAKANLDRSIEVGPRSNFPYVVSILFALREGQLDEVNRLRLIAEEGFPDPNFINRILVATIGTNRMASYWDALLSAFTNLSLGQYEDALVNARLALTLTDSPQSETYMLLGLSECVNGNYPEAETAYSQGIEIDPDFTILYLLRADVRAKQNNFQGSLLDFGAAQETPTWENFAPLIESNNAQMGCETFFDVPRE
jgi:tetratricopeptide (TPR) repeat protein